jgi:hypothetical protein
MSLYLLLFTMFSHLSIQSQLPLGSRHVSTWTFLFFTMTYIIACQNIDLSSWITLHKPIGWSCSRSSLTESQVFEDNRICSRISEAAKWDLYSPLSRVCISPFIPKRRQSGQKAEIFLAELQNKNITSSCICLSVYQRGTTPFPFF